MTDPNLELEGEVIRLTRIILEADFKLDRVFQLAFAREWDDVFDQELKDRLSAVQRELRRLYPPAVTDAP